MPKTNLDDEVTVPMIDSRVLEAVGSFVFAWGVVERELDGAFHVLFHTDPTLASCIYANLGTKAKLDMLTSAVNMLSVQLDAALTNGAHSALTSIGDLSQSARLTMAHGQPIFIGVSATKSQWEFVRQVARAAHKIVIHPSNARYWGTQAKIALRLAQRWRTCVAKIHRKTSHLTLADLESLCKTQISTSRPSRVRPQKHPLPRKHALAGRPATLAKWPRT